MLTRTEVCLTLAVIFGLDYGALASTANTPHQRLFMTSEILDVFTGDWTGSSAIYKGQTARLACFSGSPSLSNVTVKKMYETAKPLEALQYDVGYVYHTFRNISCDRIGTYLCEGEQHESKSFDLGITDCEPRLCTGENQNRTIFAGVGESTTFSLCVIAVHKINDVRYLQAPDSTKSAATTPNFEWKQEQNAFSNYTLNITLADIAQDVFGVHTFTVVSTGQGGGLNYTIVLREFGPPDCPTDLKVTSTGIDRVSLTWQPGLDGGASQSFQVFFYTDKNEWHAYDSVTDDTSITVLGLKESTHYALRVVSLNSFRRNGAEDLCLSTQETDTEHLVPSTSSYSDRQQNPEPSDETQTKDMSTVIALVSVVVIVIGVAVVGVVLITKIVQKMQAVVDLKKKRAKESQPMTHDSIQHVEEMENRPNEELTDVATNGRPIAQTG